MNLNTVGILFIGVYSLTIGCKANHQVGSDSNALNQAGASATYKGRGTNYENFSEEGGGCGPTEALVELEAGAYVPYAALRVPQNGVYDGSTYNQGKNCGRWLEVSTVVDGVKKTGHFIVADRCTDPGWCQDAYHVDLSVYQVGHVFFGKNDFTRRSHKLGSGWPFDFKNRDVEWNFISAPNYDGQGPYIHWTKAASEYFRAIIISNLPEGLGGVEFLDGSGNWVTAKMEGDRGQIYRLDGNPATRPYQIRISKAVDATKSHPVYEKIYQFDFPKSCNPSCPSVTKAEVTAK